MYSVDNGNRQLVSVLLSANKNGGSMWRSLKERSNITDLIKVYLDKTKINAIIKLQSMWHKHSYFSDNRRIIRFNRYSKNLSFKRSKFLLMGTCHIKFSNGLRYIKYRPRHRLGPSTYDEHFSIDLVKWVTNKSMYIP